MKSLLPIIGDTWRQSRKQVVFIIMLVLLLLIAATVIILPRTFEGGEETEFGLIVSDEPMDFFDTMWFQNYAQTEIIQEQGSSNLMSASGTDNLKSRAEAIRETYEKGSKLSLLQRSVEAYISMAVAFIFTLSMWFFIGASSGYFPDMISAGAVDLLVSKPLGRTKIYLAKYLGGLALFAGALTAIYLLIFVGIGLRTGIWHSRLFMVLPAQVFVAASLFSILALVGVVTRSSTLATILGFAFYLIVDSVIGALIGAQMMGAFEEIGWLDKTVDVIRYTLPNFGFLKERAAEFALNTPHLNPMPFFVAAAWMAISLLLGIWRFRRSDY